MKQKFRRFMAGFLAILVWQERVEKIRRLQLQSQLTI